MDTEETMASDDTMATDGDAMDMDTANLIRTRDITGGNIYTMNPEDWMSDESTYDPMAGYENPNDNWEVIGEIEDIVLSKDGQMVGIVAEVGGFLDIGDKHVMIPVSDVRLTAVDDQTYAYVTNKTEEELESMESVDEGFWN